jgi:diguanylate cyclase
MAPEQPPKYIYKEHDIRPEDVRVPTEHDTFVFEGRPVRAFIQPQTTSDGSRVVGGELLLRTIIGNHVPGRLIEDAEQNGSIHEVTLGMLRCAAIHSALLAQHGTPTRMSVNISPAELNHGLIDEVREILAEAKVRPSSITLEITERQPIEEHHYSTLRALHDLGVHLALDDFGSQWADMETLMRLQAEDLHMDEIKVDKGLLDTDKAVGVVQELFAQGFHNVVVEGVEDLKRAAAIFDRRVVLQGYATGKAMPFRSFSERVAAGHNSATRLTDGNNR